MKKILLLFCLLVSAVAFGQSLTNFVQSTIPKPNPPRLVNDFAHVLTPEQAQALEHKLVAYNDST